jgi:predicted nucleic acid-binding protein
LIVADASVLIDFLLRSAGEPELSELIAQQDTLVAPGIVDIEVTNVLRRLVQRKAIGLDVADSALADFLDLRIERHGSTDTLWRIWEIRNNVSAYDAAYVALAEVAGVPLYTRDAKLAATAGHAAKIVLI